MQFLKPVLVLALLTASVVLFPLRRAQAAFAVRTPGSTTVAQRKPVRRRLVPGGPLAELRNDSPRIIESARHAAAVAGADHDKQSARELAAPSDAPRDGGTHDCCDPMVDGIVTIPQPEQLDTNSPSPEPVVTAQSVGDIPVPPPKQIA